MPSAGTRGLAIPLPTTSPYQPRIRLRKRGIMQSSMDAPSVTIVAVSPRPTAVVAATTSWTEFPTVWRTLLDEVWAFLRGHEELRGEGHNVMLYRDDTPRVEVGVLVTRSFEGQGLVAPSALPGGTAAMTVHRGPYDGLGAAHAAVLKWSTANGRRVTGLRWEIYGDWHDDPTRLETEVYWQLAT